jgi:AICAR transformylase/IMP cyclohydrolase PurH
MEFMDRTMPSLDIYGVEIQKHSNGSSTILSRNFIQSAVKQEAVAKIARETFQWTQETYDQRVLQISGEASLDVIRAIRSSAIHHGIDIRYGAGAKQAGLLAYAAGKLLFTIYVYSGPEISVYINKVDMETISKKAVSANDMTVYFEDMKSLAPSTKITETCVMLPVTELKSAEAQNKLFDFFRKVLGKA